jgi:CRP-like cAMP-binding protein
MMQAGTRQTGKALAHRGILRDLVPLNALSDERFDKILSSLIVEEVNVGCYLFGEGETDNRTIYLLDGEVNFVSASGRITGAVRADAEPGRYPLANQQPRIISARVTKKSVIAHFQSSLLDVLLTFDQSEDIQADNLHTEIRDDWMTRVLQSEAFVKLPPADTQLLLKSLRSVSVLAGDVIIKQGDEGDYFYIVREGRCTVTRQASDESWDVPLAELSDGDFFGEEALVSDGKRNATVTMLTDGILMRLAKQDFIDLVKKPLVHYIDYEIATAMTIEGDTWLDVRLSEEYAVHALKNSINIPLQGLRDRAGKLDTEKKYIICCDTGRRSAAAAFLLSQRGFEVYVLDGGLNKAILTASPDNTSGSFTSATGDTAEVEAPEQLRNELAGINRGMGYDRKRPQIPVNNWQN